MAFISYKSNPAGMRELGRSSFVRAACMNAANAVAAYARADDPDGEYTVYSTTVTAGWDNEERAGAAVDSTKASAGGRRRTLVRAIQEAKS